ncbi:integrase arm-type DNA-binding domain-containing protein [Croceicoccus sp. YJ47]|uniref:tyrosine-type recombinase/integrase n=1 Tax=Croceicoccus sp. YJ47 TaxID=2798724 RepID=UPI0019208E24|nr:integrase arm-type DNA-binding domain-containing protein [Croceicoccus sp. YJ47]QQN73190.1 integrase arm-type DNA-binding domain-containing protein [Croceicoccus sp. YJ47]
MLTDKACRTAQPAEKPRKIFDGNGLHLYITSKGFKSWRLKYRFGGKEKQLTFGPYPNVSLKEARTKRDEALHELREGRDPDAIRKNIRDRRAGRIETEFTFRQAALRWHRLQSEGWKPRHAVHVMQSLEADAFPSLGSIPLRELKPSHIRSAIDAVQDRGSIDGAHRLLWRISAIFDLAIASEQIDLNPASSLSAVLKPVPKRKYSALLDVETARRFLLAVEARPGQPSTKLASRLLALTAARPGMIRFAERAEFEDIGGANPIWRIPAAKMKLEKDESEQSAFDFIIPLSRQAVEVFKLAADLAGRRSYLFPSQRHSHRPISENALNVAYRHIPGFERKHVPHGWRSTFSTIMNERAAEFDRPGDRAIIDLMLAHQPRGVEAIYNRAAYMPTRRRIAQEWADLLMEGMPAPEKLLMGPRN